MSLINVPTKKMFHTSYDSGKKQWNGLKTNPSFNKRTSLGDAILATLERNGSKIAQIDAITGCRTTFNELHTKTIHVTKNLQNLGYKKHDIVLFFTNNSSEITPLVFGALNLGCTVMAEYTGDGEFEICSLLKTIKPKIIFCDAEYFSLLKECTVKLKVSADFFTFGEQIANARSIKYLLGKSLDGSNFEPPTIDASNDVAFIVCTSGSTGNAKGLLYSKVLLTTSMRGDVCKSYHEYRYVLIQTVPLTHANVLNRMRKMWFMTSDDIALGFTSVDAISGLRFLISATLHGSARIVNQGEFTEENFFGLVEQFKVTFTSSTKFRVHQLLHHPGICTANLSSMKIFRAGGATMPMSYINKLNKYLPNGKFCHSFAMTEMAGVIAFNFDHANNNCVGQLIDDIEAKIVDEEGNRLGINETGELCLRDPFLFKGYFGDDENVRKCFDREGWFKTGDIARFDENNDLFIVDRIKEQFQCVGAHVIPSEIQEFLNRIDGVYDSCVVPVPEPKYDNLPAAVIVKTKSSTCTEKSIQDAVASTFANPKHLRGGVYFVDSFPKTHTGKIARHSIINMAVKFYDENVNSPTLNLF